jgi:hypothetical protein
MHVFGFRFTIIHINSITDWLMLYNIAVSHAKIARETSLDFLFTFYTLSVFLIE